MKAAFRLILWLYTAVFLLSLICCAQYEQPSLNPEVPETYQGEGVFYCNGIDGFAKDGIILPDFEVKTTDSSRYGVNIYYQNVSALQMATYCTEMEQAGFTVVKDTYHTYFYSDTCFVGVSYTENISTGEVRLYWHAQSSHVPTDGLHAEQAKQVIGTDCPYTLIDVTPENFFDATGGQLFYIPSYEREAETDENGLAVGTQEFYNVYFVTKDYAVPLGYRMMALADLDQNGVREIWTLSAGPTSGLFTFYLMAFENGALKYQTLHCTEYGQLYFAQDGDELRISHKKPEYENREVVHYEVKTCEIKFFDGTPYVTFNGVPLELWGIP